MIFEKRQIHRYTFTGLAIILPVLLILPGLLLRPSYVAEGDEATAELFAQAGFVTGESGEVIAAESLRLNGGAIAAESFRLADGTVVLDLQPGQDLQIADASVYWAPGDTPPEAIADDAVFLGSLSGTSRRRLTIPAEIQGQPGQLLFFSQARQQVIGASPLDPALTQSP